MPPTVWILHAERDGPAAQATRAGLVGSSRYSRPSAAKRSGPLAPAGPRASPSETSAAKRMDGQFIKPVIVHLANVLAVEPVQLGQIETGVGAQDLRQIKRLDDFVSEFLRFTRPPKLNVERLPVRPLLTDLVAFITPECSKKGVALDVDLCGPDTAW